MPTPNDLLNARIARLKGWSQYGSPDDVTKCWQDEKGTIRDLPNWTGTLDGIKVLMRELQENASPGTHWFWGWYIPTQLFEVGLLAGRTLYTVGEFHSPFEKPGECVGMAYVSMKEKKEETDDKKAGPTGQMCAV